MNIEDITEKEAWLIGFDIGYKACVDDDKPMKAIDFAKKVASGELNDVLLMMNVGRDDANGIWTILGIRMAIYMILLTEWDASTKKDATAMDEIWNSIESQSPEVVAAMVAESLTEQLMIPIVMIDDVASAFIRPYLVQ